jgi:1-acyl-sn-glycerol-3-phosphate acyltransferase
VRVILRSILYNVVFYLNVLAWLVVAVPTFVLPRRCVIEVAKAWGRSNVWLLRIICGIKVEWRGLEKIPAGPLLVASKHQSAWETFALLSLFTDPTFIQKRELMWIPIFGWLTWKGGMIPVDRGAGSQALADMTEHARRAVAENRQIIIFPEGTRRPPGAEPKYKFGVVHLYAETGVPCLPIALNSGLFWPRRSMRRYPGTIRVEVLDPILPGLAKDEFFTRLQTEVETATARLVAAGKRELKENGFRDVSLAQSS